MRPSIRVSLAALALALGSPARAEVRVVARLDMAVPATEPFLLRATIPVEKGVFPRADGQSPFSVRFPGKPARVVPAQAEVVSRYPTGEADVVEIVARGELDADLKVGARMACAVLYDDALTQDRPADAEPPERVVHLLDPKARGRVLVRTRDVYGNAYAAELAGNPDGVGFGSFRVLKHGRWLEEDRAYATLAPIRTDAEAPLGGPPLPHLMGVHAYWTKTSIDDAVGLCLRVNNGAVSGNRPATALEAPLGIVYWKSLELVVPKGWSVVPEVGDPFLGEPYEEGDRVVVPVVKPYPDGALHMMGPQAQFERRFVLVPTGSERIARARLAFDGLAFPARGGDLWSWSNPSTARYFPQKEPLASVDFFSAGGLRGKAAVRRMHAAQLAELRAGLETGTARGWYVQSKVMGWAHPWFIPDQGGVGGEGIATFEGHWAAQGASKDGVALLALQHRMNVCRQPEATYDAQGDVVGYERWLDANGAIPFDYRTNGGVVIPCFRLPMRWGPPPSQQVLDVVKRGLRPPYDQGNPYEKEGRVPYDGAILSWWPHDDQHLVRYTKNLKALAWLANDSMAKDDLRLSAELFHLMFHEGPHVPAEWSPGVTLEVYATIAAQHPHGGLPMGREHAWGIDAMCAAYALAGDEWRARARPWFDRVEKLMTDASMPSGLLQRVVNERVLGNTKYCVAQTFEALFLVHAMRCMSESVYRDVEPRKVRELGALAQRTADYLFFGPPWQRIPADWQPDPAHPTIFYQGPRQGIAVSLNDDRATSVFSDASQHGPGYLPKDGLGGGVEIITQWPALAYVAEWTEGSAGKGLENKYLERALDCWSSHATYKDLMQAFAEQAGDPSRDNSVNWFGLMARLQNLGVK